MPIVITVLNPNAPLSQGDLLKGVPLFCTDQLSTASLFSTASSANSKTTIPYCLVLSRPCVAEHKERVVVAAVERYAPALPEFEDFDEAKTYFADVRDGKSSPDVFYLGQLPNEAGSFCARLDSLYTLRLPPEKAPDRHKPVLAARVATLDASFARDLHLRVFRSFASLGFDDHDWYSDADLDVLLTLGDRDRARAQIAYTEAVLALQLAETQGEPKKDKALGGRRDDVAKKWAAIEELERTLAPLRAVRDARARRRTLPGVQPVDPRS